MNIQLSTCLVHFPEDFDERGEWEVERKGWLQGVQVELTNGNSYPLFFYDPIRLSQDLEADAKQGRTAIAEPGMVIVAEVTRECILRAVETLISEGFFDHLKPLVPVEANGVAH